MNACKTLNINIQYLDDKFEIIKGPQSQITIETSGDITQKR